MASNQLGSVQQKVSCVYEISILPEQSNKRSHQPFNVQATDELLKDAIDHDIYTATATEKLDGTCCFIQTFNEKPWLWARHDRRPTKQAERLFRKYETTHNSWKVNGCCGSEPTFQWNMERDFKDVPPDWEACSGAKACDGIAQPDAHGHIPGWVPVDLKSRQHCWHISAVDLNTGLALVLRSRNDDLEIILQPLSELQGHTAELIGTNVNANPYKIGSKQFPIHFLVIHGSLKVDSSPTLDRCTLSEWFQSPSLHAKIEGIVWHCVDGTLYKLHRHHIGLAWPVEMPYLSQRRVYIALEDQDIRCRHGSGDERKGSWRNVVSRLLSSPDCCCNGLSELSTFLENVSLR